MRALFFLIMIIPIFCIAQGNQEESYINPKKSFNIIPSEAITINGTALVSSQFRLSNNWAIQPQVGYIFKRYLLNDNQKLNTKAPNFVVKAELSRYLNNSDGHLNKYYISTSVHWKQLHLSNSHIACLNWESQPTFILKGYKCTESVSNQYEVLRNEYALTFKAGRIYRLSNYLRADLFFGVGAGYFSTKTKGKIEGIPNPVNFNVFEGVIWEFDEKLNGVMPVMTLGVSIGYYLN